MASRFEEATSDVVAQVNEVVRTKFPSLSGCLIEVVMDTKKRKSGGKYSLVKLDKASPIIKHISADNTNEFGLDYILYIDQKVYNELSESDRIRLISHGLYHSDVDFEKENPYACRKPTVQTFCEEIHDNEDDPRWAERLDLIAEGVYEREAEANGEA
jgi:hypothetical protein